MVQRAGIEILKNSDKTPLSLRLIAYGMDSTTATIPIVPRRLRPTHISNEYHYREKTWFFTR